MENQMLWEDGPEEDFISLVERDWSKSMFIENAEALLGSDWKKRGRQILEEDAPELLDRFKKYAS